MGRVFWVRLLVLRSGGCPGPDGVLTYEYRDPHGYYCGHNGVQDWAFRNEKEAWSAYFNFNVEIGDSGTELFTDILFCTSESSSHYGARYIFAAYWRYPERDPIWNYYPNAVTCSAV